MYSRYRLAYARTGIISTLRPIWFLVALTCLLVGRARSVDVPQIEGEAPPGQDVLKFTQGGAFCVDKSLKEEYDRLVSRVRTLQADLDAERIGGGEALLELQDLQAKLNLLRNDIEKKKVLVSIGKIHKQSETTTFDLGPARLLVITADNIRVEGWDGPQVKCVLEKTVITPDDKPIDEHLQGLKLIHHHGIAPNVVGKTSAEQDADEQKFLASPDGQKLTEQQRESRRKLIGNIADSYNLYQTFQGKEIDTLEIEGLTYEQGNRPIVIGISSPGGGGRSLSSGWQRHVALTVYVPACQSVALRGCLENLDVQGIHGALAVTRGGSHDIDYDGSFRIRDLHGSLLAENVPLDLVDSIRGNVNITCTLELVNTGTQYKSGERTMYTPPPRLLTCRKIDGDITTWFTRADLNLESIDGRIDVKNEFGKTTLVVGRALAVKAHRVVSESGRIEVRLAPGSLGTLPLCALTNCGTVRTNAEQDVLKDTSFTVGRDDTGASRGWQGVKSNSRSAGFNAGEFLAGIDRVAAVLQDRDRSPGLDLISRGGIVQIIYEH
jgi:hypothetical protein